MKNIRSLIIIFLILFFSLSILLSCGGNDIPSKDIPSKDIPPAKRESFSEVRTIKVYEEQSYYDDKGNKIEDFSLLVYEDCEKILENIGFSVTGKNGKKYDSILEIKMSGTTMCDYYKDMETNKKLLLYAGAELDGSISLRIDDVDSVGKDFSEVLEPPIMIGGTKRLSPSDAPFDRLGWQKHLFMILSDVWGPDIFLKSLEVEGISMRRNVIEAMAESQSCPVDYLIDILEDESLEHFGVDIMEVLGKKGDEKAVPVLAEILINRESSWEREVAAKALGRIGSEDGLDALNRVLEEDEDEEVQEACREAIDIILGSEGND